jgi:hypothetical protein
MYCTACGQQIDQSLPACPQCGRPVMVVPVAAPPAPQFYVRVHRHVQTLSILWIVYAIYTLFSWMIALPFLTGFFGGWAHHFHGEFGNHGVFGHLPWLAPLITVILLGRAILSAATGLALMRRAPWARTLAIVTAFLTLIKPISGTALAIYTLWVLLPTSSGQEYDQIAVT